MNNSARLIMVLVVFSAVSLSAQSPTPVAATQDDAFQVRYQSGLPISGQSVVNIPNAGAAPSPANPTAASPAPTATVAPVASSATEQRSPAPMAMVAPVATQPVTKTTPEPRAGSQTVVRDRKTRGQHGQRVYHKDGSKSHERTKKGKYTREQRATKEGDHASKEEGKTKNQ